MTLRKIINKKDLKYYLMLSSEKSDFHNPCYNIVSTVCFLKSIDRSYHKLKNEMINAFFFKYRDNPFEKEK